MYAIIESGGKQYRVEKGTRVKVESLRHEKGADFSIERVLMLAQEGNVQIGQPTVAGAIVSAKVLTHDRAKKIIVFKKRSKKTYKKTQGHRQNYTEIEITSIAA